MQFANERNSNGRSQMTSVNFLKRDFTDEPSIRWLKAVVAYSPSLSVRFIGRTMTIPNFEVRSPALTSCTSMFDKLYKTENKAVISTKHRVQFGSVDQ